MRSVFFCLFPPGAKAGEMTACKMHIGAPAAWIEVEGEDSFSFLQGQFSNDLRRPAPSPVTYGLWLDRKGKVVADSFILQLAEDRFFLLSYYSPAEVLLARLEPYIIADDVALRDLTPLMRVVSVWGSDAGGFLARAGWPPAAPGTFAREGNSFLLNGRRSALPNADVVFADEETAAILPPLQRALEECGGTMVDETEVERERVRSCLPAIPRDIGPGELPQEGNLDHDALSYDKGCYLGQEVMARIRAMGQVRRTLARARIDATGTAGEAPLFHGEKQVGHLKTVVPGSPALGLALIRMDALGYSQSFALSPGGDPCVTIGSHDILNT